MARGDQLARQWRIIQQLAAARHGKTAPELARSLGCHVRTVYRDLEALEAGGFPLYVEKQESGAGRWHILDRQRHQVPLPLTLPEAMALYLSRNLLAAVGGVFFRGCLDELIDKLEATLTDEIKAYVNRMVEKIAVQARQRARSAPDAVVADLLRALAENRQVEMTYYTMSRRQVTRRVVDPYHVHFFADGFYLIAHCHLRGDVRVFATDRIHELRVLATTFRPPEGFDPQVFFGESFGVTRGRRLEVKVAFTPAAAGYVAEKTWHPTQKLEYRSDGTLVWSAAVAGTIELKRWLLQWGAQAKVLEPADLAEQMAAEARAMAARYRRAEDNGCNRRTKRAADRSQKGTTP